MSRPGYWKTKDGTEMKVTDMTVSHLKNSLRVMRTSLLQAREWEPSAYKVNKINYCETKLEELGTEAQRRNIIPNGDLTIDQLCDIIAPWQAERDGTRPAAPFVAQVPAASIPAPPPDLQVRVSAAAVQAAASWLNGEDIRVESNNRHTRHGRPGIGRARPKGPKYITSGFEPIKEVARLTGYIIHSGEASINVEMDRRLDTDL